jgi:hypothetical protein
MIGESSQKPAKKRGRGRPFPKGICVNPAGKPKLPENVAGLRSMSLEEGRRRISQLIRINNRDLEEVAADDNAPVFERYIAKVLLKGIKEADWYVLDSIMNRLWGKPTERIETHNLNVNADLDLVPREKLLALMTEINAGKLNQDGAP